MLGQQLDHGGKPIPVEREVGHVLVYLRTPGADRVLELVVAMREPVVPMLLIEQDGRSVNCVTNEGGYVHGQSPSKNHTISQPQAVASPSAESTEKNEPAADRSALALFRGNRDRLRIRQV